MIFGPNLETDMNLEEIRELLVAGMVEVLTSKLRGPRKRSPRSIRLKIANIDAEVHALSGHLGRRLPALIPEESKPHAQWALQGLVVKELRALGILQGGDPPLRPPPTRAPNSDAWTEDENRLIVEKYFLVQGVLMALGRGSFR